MYQLSLSENPPGIPPDDFEQNGYLYHLTGVTQVYGIGVDTQAETETITQDSDTGELSEVLKQLPGQKEVKMTPLKQPPRFPQSPSMTLKLSTPKETVSKTRVPFSVPSS